MSRFSVQYSRLLNVSASSRLSTMVIEITVASKNNGQLQSEPQDNRSPFSQAMAKIGIDTVGETCVSATRLVNFFSNNINITAKV